MGKMYVNNLTLVVFFAQTTFELYIQKLFC